MNYQKILPSVFFIAVLSASALAQTDKDTGIKYYKAGNYDLAVKSLKKAVKSSPQDAAVVYYLGASYLKRNDFKESIKTLTKARDMSPNDPTIRVALGYAYLLGNETNSARIEALYAIKLEPKNPEANYIAGVAAYREQSYDTAYNYSNKALEAVPNFAFAYLLKSEALISSFAKQGGTIVKPPQERYLLLEEASGNLAKYVALSPPGKETDYYRDYLESVKFFSDYYNHIRPEFHDAEKQSPGDTSKVRIISKPRAPFTESARQANVTGYADVVVGFGADGTIKHVLVIRSLSHGLSESAVRAARQIKFEPATLNGKPVSAVATIRYSFTIF